MDEKSFNDFREIIRELAHEEATNILKNNGLYRAHVGEVMRQTSPGNYDVDIFDTVLHNVTNKSGQALNVRDSVTVFEQYGSNYQNCFIIIKNDKIGT